MTVIVQKPEFNLRDKLSELDFHTVPYHKMPMGSIVQVQQALNSTQSSHTNADVTIVGPITFTRRSPANAVLLTTSFNYVHTNANGRFRFRIGTDRLEETNLADSMLELHSFFGEDDPPWGSGYALRHATGSFLYEPTLSNTGSASKIMEGAQTCMFDVQFFHHTKNGGTLYLNQGKSNSNVNFFPGTCSFTIFEIKR